MTTDTDRMNKKIGTITSGEYTSLHTISLSEASSYYLLTEYNLAIPVSRTAQDTFSLIATSLGDWNLPEKVHDLPICSASVLRTALSHYHILPVLVTLLTVKPIHTITDMERNAAIEADRIKHALRPAAATALRNKKVTGSFEL